jgi:hypothetical protein
LSLFFSASVTFSYTVSSIKICFSSRVSTLFFLFPIIDITSLLHLGFSVEMGIEDDDFADEL